MKSHKKVDKKAETLAPAEPSKSDQEKVLERREEVLATGRKFKYPLQWTKHRIVINTVMIAVIVSALLITSGWLALYQFGMTNDLLFRVTEALPVPVAKVINDEVRFSDYLMFYRSSMTSIERQSGQVDNQSSYAALEAQYKRAALTESEEYTYALNLAKELGIEVASSEVDAEFNRHLGIGGVERNADAFMKIIEENFGLDRTEYRRMLYLALIKAKVEQYIDTNASSVANRVETLLIENGGDYVAVYEALGAAVQYEETGGMVSSQNIDGGRASEAIKLEPGQQSGRFISINGDGYYFVKLIAKTDAEVNFVSIKVPFTEFTNRFTDLRNTGQIDEYIKIDNPLESQ